VSARHFERRTGDRDTDPECIFDSPDMRIMLSEQIGQKTMIVEMKLQ
jgi:hypothetical protein